MKPVHKTLKWLIRLSLVRNVPGRGKRKGANLKLLFLQDGRAWGAHTQGSASCYTGVPQTSADSSAGRVNGKGELRSPSQFGEARQKKPGMGNFNGMKLEGSQPTRKRRWGA